MASSIANATYDRAQDRGEAALNAYRALAESYRAGIEAMGRGAVSAADARSTFGRLSVEFNTAVAIHDTFTDAAASVETIDADPEAYGDDLLERYPALDVNFNAE
jgi:hypothetical protein